MRNNSIGEIRVAMNIVLNEPLEAENDSNVVEAELNRLLQERKFAGAPQMSAFLKYIVRQTLNGDADRIKAYSVGVDALGKPDSFDAQTDPSVRVLALRLRKTLKTIYSTATKNLAIIDLQVGTYVPEFYKPSAAYSENLLSSVSADVASSSAGSPELRSVSPASEPSGDVFAANDGIAVKPARDQDTAGQRSVDGGLPLTTGRPSKGNLLKRVAQSGAAERAAQWPSLDKWTLITAVFLLAAAWQINILQPGQADTATATLPLLPAATNQIASPRQNTDTVSAPAFFAARPEEPTVYIELVNTQPDLHRQLMLMLSSSFVQAGTVRVVRRDDSVAQQNRQFWPGEYQLLVSGFTVDNDLQVNAQLVSLFSGEMLSADTITVDRFEQRFSSQDLLTIESVASGIVSVDGPLYQDYCSHAGSNTQIDCQSS